MIQVIKNRIPAAFQELNRKALDIGLNLGKQYRDTH